MAKRYARTEAPIAAQIFANAATEYMKRYGATAEDFAQVALINHVHSQHNLYSHFRDIHTMDQILKSQMIQSPLTKLQCCPNQRRRGSSCHIVSSIPQPATSPQISGHPYPRTMCHG